MPRRGSVWALTLGLGLLFACGKDSPTGPSNGPPAHLTAVSASTTSVPVGTTLTGVTVKVTDAGDRPVIGAAVGFTVGMGGGTVDPRLVVTDSNGVAKTAWTIGTVAGANQLTAMVSSATIQLPPINFSATGVSGPVVAISLSPVSARLLPAVDTTRINAQSLDSFGNVTTPAPVFVVRDPTLLSVDGNGLVHVLRRGGSTYVVASAGGKIDSVQVTVLVAGQSLCTGVANPLDLAVGQTVTDISGSAVCIHASAAGAEYAVVPFFYPPVVASAIPIDVATQGVAPLGRPSAAIAASLAPAARRNVAASPVVPNSDFESRLRATARREVPALLPAARAWYSSRIGGAARRATTAAAPATPAVGDLMTLNVSVSSFCGTPDLRTGRVAAVTNKAIVVSDTANPAGGFTDAEFQSIGVTFDTLVDPTDRAAFGDPSDIDNNGHVIMFFTRAVNELTTQGSGTVTLGFFDQRDLFPRAPTPPLTGAACPGSNVAEMFYLIVPDTGGLVNGNRRSKSSVVTYTNGTVAHEYQHLINASRRMYVNNAGTGTEERWLDEGLAHVAEELNFFKASGRSPRTNLTSSAFTDLVFATAYATFEANNFNRYATYLPSTESQGPIGTDADDDDLPTRGAIWSFLRYAADHQPAGTENAFWFKLVNSQTTGIANLTAVLGVDPGALFRDWAISVFTDDNAVNLDPRFLQPSWNDRSILTYFSPTSQFPLFTRTLSDAGPTSLTLYEASTSFLRFSVASGADALITLTSNGQPLPSTVKLSVVRVK